MKNAIWTTMFWWGLCLVAMAANVAVVKASQVEPAGNVLFFNGNNVAVLSQPTKSTTFTLTREATITSISNYHYLNQAALPGTIAIKDQVGKVYGPWQATGREWGVVANAYWDVVINISLPSGTYTIVDSHPATWSQNAESGGAGFSWVRGNYSQINSGNQNAGANNTTPKPPIPTPTTASSGTNKPTTVIDIPKPTPPTPTTSPANTNSGAASGEAINMVGAWEYTQDRGYTGQAVIESQSGSSFTGHVTLSGGGKIMNGKVSGNTVYFDRSWTGNADQSYTGTYSVSNGIAKVEGTFTGAGGGDNWRMTKQVTSTSSTASSGDKKPVIDIPKPTPTTTLATSSNVSITYDGMASGAGDLVGDWKISPNGQYDCVYSLNVNFNHEKIDYITIADTTTTTTNYWYTKPSEYVWLLALYQNGTLLNPERKMTTQVFNGNTSFVLRAHDNGCIKAGGRFKVTIFTDKTTYSKEFDVAANKTYAGSTTAVTSKPVIDIPKPTPTATASSGDKKPVVEIPKPTPPTTPNTATNKPDGDIAGKYEMVVWQNGEESEKTVVIIGTITNGRGEMHEDESETKIGIAYDQKTQILTCTSTESGTTAQLQMKFSFAGNVTAKGTVTVEIDGQKQSAELTLTKITDDGKEKDTATNNPPTASTGKTNNTGNGSSQSSTPTAMPTVSTEKPTIPKPNPSSTANTAGTTTNPAALMDAKYALASKAYYSGRYAEAVPLLRELAEQRHAKAQHHLGRCYYNGWSVNRDPSIARKWLRDALPELRRLAEQGDAEAQDRLGGYYQYGLVGVAKNPTEALRWYQKAAEQGWVNPYYNIGN